ncbi:MAG: efflux RND transporter permease subunit [Lachnospira sp.]|nr:efflux RND transporter permease subunit [Lachnospira sp.]MDD5831512.1 efflux RND transporter permease subunit [Lachnospira sp.]
MEKLGRGIVKARIPILVISILLLIPAALGYINTRVNYDILYYLPKEIDTMQGQDILLDEFQKGAYAIVVVDGMHGRELTKLEDKIENVDHVAKLISYNSIVGGDIPLEMIPEKLRSQFYNSDKDSTMLAIFFDDTTSSDGTMNAIKEIRKVTDGQCFISGMSAVVTDTKTLSEKETPIYVLIAVILACIVLALFMDSFLVPVFFMLSIGIAIVYNLGSNYFMGEVSYITKALAAVLQLGVTLDYSIFLWHSYKEMKEEYGDDHKEAMAHAIASTITSVVGSSITTVAGFIALCFMSFTLGMDLGVVMAKGVVFGVICCVTVLPSLILTFDKALERTMHREILPARFDKLAGFIVNHAWIFIVIFVALLGPAIYGYQHTNVYYDLAETLPANLDCSIANKKLEENFDVNSIYMILADSELNSKDANKMMTEIKDLDGVTFALGLDSAIGNEIPKELIPESLKSELVSDKHQIMMVGSDYKVASDEINNQITTIQDIAKKYDSTSMVIGEAPCTKDLITITDTDFQRVSAVSIGAIVVIILLVFKSISLPVVLVAAIEFAIFINMGLPYYLGTTIPFIASVVIGTIQLGATVDYAILMTTRYKRERFAGATKKEAITTALSTSIPSIIVSALGFFAATFGVGLISSVDMIGSLCSLMARGAIVSMIVVIFVLPSLFVLLDKIIIHTSMGFIDKSKKQA